MTERRKHTPEFEFRGRSLYRITRATFEVIAGMEINGTIAEAIQMAQSNRMRFVEDTKGALISFEFNGVDVSVHADSNPDLIYRDWSRALSGYIDKAVSPYPKKVLTEEELANDARIEAENEQRRQREQVRYEVKARARQRRVEKKLSNAEPIELADKVAWQKFKDVNRDTYGGAVVIYAERWARLMKVEMTEGHTLEEVAESASYEADLEGITGFMYGVAVSTLAQTWKHGEKLRRWHNLKTQFGDEGERANESGGVLNPALLSLGSKES